MKNRYGCKFGLPHDLKAIHETPQVKVEICQICNERFKWNKGFKGRVQNIEYLKKMLASSKVSDEVVLEFSTDYPLKMSFVEIDRFNLVHILAPRVDDE